MKISRFDFFEKLYSFCDGLLELRALPDKNRIFFKPTSRSDINDFCSTYRNNHLYFGVATRDGKGGKKDNIIHIPAVWSDIDFKNTESLGLKLVCALVDQLNGSITLRKKPQVSFKIKFPVANKE